MLRHKKRAAPPEYLTDYQYDLTFFGIGKEGLA
jgi:hypothetical protein